MIVNDPRVKSGFFFGTDSQFGVEFFKCMPVALDHILWFSLSSLLFHPRKYSRGPDHFNAEAESVLLVVDETVQFTKRFPVRDDVDSCEIEIRMQSPHSANQIFHRGARTAVGILVHQARPCVGPETEKFGR